MLVRGRRIPYKPGNMKFSWNWLREWLPLTESPEAFADRLTMAGIEVEGIHVQGRGLEKIIVARILKSAKHPNADRLSVCEVEMGSGVRQIVCGASNYKVDDKVPLALPGVKLPDGMEIRRSKIRGVESDGMMCSSKELGLAEDAQGLLILDPSCNPGEPLSKVLGLDDTILDLEITPNRPDLLSHWGLAREIAALMGGPALDPQRILSKEDEQRLAGSSLGNCPIPIRVEDPTGCPRYTGRVLRGVKVGPSPAWLRRRLEALGHRSISNVVDITNYVLWEIGQPLHAFDLKLLKGPAIVVRRARAGEKLTRLDDETSELKEEMLVIADAERPVALAGVIGGRETAVSDATTDILLESATFQSALIRKTSKKLALSTDSSYRFERGVDIELAGWAGLRATALILQVCGGRVEGGPGDVRVSLKASRQIRCRHPRVRSLLGVSIDGSEINSTLQRLGCRVESTLPTADSCEVWPPSHRLDLEREVDLIEEIGRVYGIQRIPATLQPTRLSTTRDSDHFLFARRLRALVTALGFDEASTYTVVSAAQMAEIDASQNEQTILLTNPLSSEMDALRPSLFPGLLAAGARNLAAGNAGAAFFEVGKVFQAQDGKNSEASSLGLLLAGKRREGASWENGVHGTAWDFYDLKGRLEALLENLGLLDVPHRGATPAEAPMLEPGLGFVLLHENRVVGCAGKVQTALARRAKLAVDACYAQLDVQWLLAEQRPLTRYQPWSVYPSIRRDIALSVPAATNHQHIVETAQRLAKKHAEPSGIFLRNIELFDIFQPVQMGGDKKSMAYAMIYRSPKRTLTDQEVNQVHEAIKDALKTGIPCEVRE